MNVSPSRLVPALAAAALLAGCDVPNVPVGDLPNFGGGSGPTISGTLSGVQAGSNVRVALLGQARGGAARQELVSTALSGSSYSLQLPASPPLSMMSNDNESFAFSVAAYKDLNSNGRYDTTDEVLEAAADNGTFRFFAEGGPAGSYVEGWNRFENGRYTQNFNTAVNLRGEGA